LRPSIATKHCDQALRPSIATKHCDQALQHKQKKMNLIRCQIYFLLFQKKIELLLNPFMHQSVFPNQAKQLIKCPQTK